MLGLASVCVAVGESETRRLSGLSFCHTNVNSINIKIIKRFAALGDTSGLSVGTSVLTTVPSAGWLFRFTSHSLTTDYKSLYAGILNSIKQQLLEYKTQMNFS